MISVLHEIADVVDRKRRRVMLTSDFDDTPLLFEYPTSGIDDSWYTSGSLSDTASDAEPCH